MKLTRTFAPLALIVAAAALTACGGGGDATAQRTDATAQAVQVAGTCLSQPTAGGTLKGSMQVVDDVYQYPQPFGAQDRVQGTLAYTNTTGTAQTIEVVARSTRKITAAAGFVAVTNPAQPPFYLYVSALDVTTNQLLPDDTCTQQLTSLPAGQETDVDESVIFDVSVPAGHTVYFDDHARILPEVGTTGTTSIETVGLDFSISAL